MSPFPVGPATLFPVFASFPPSRFSKWQALMGCPCLSSCLLRQMSAVSAVITAQLNINDSLAWQVLAGQRRGERGTPLDKTRNEKEKWWLYLLDRFSFVSLNLYMYVCHQQILGLTWRFYCPVFLPLWGDEPLCIPIAPHPSYWHCWHSFQASVCMCECMCTYIYLHTQACGVCASRSFEGRVCFLHILVCFLEESILNFDVGTSDSDDGRSQWKLRGTVRGEKNGQSRRGGS